MARIPITLEDMLPLIYHRGSSNRREVIHIALSSRSRGISTEILCFGFPNLPNFNRLEILRKIIFSGYSSRSEDKPNREALAVTWCCWHALVSPSLFLCITPYINKRPQLPLFAFRLSLQTSAITLVLVACTGQILTAGLNCHSTVQK